VADYNAVNGIELLFRRLLVGYSSSKWLANPLYWAQMSIKKSGFRTTSLH